MIDLLHFIGYGQKRVQTQIERYLQILKDLNADNYKVFANFLLLSDTYLKYLCYYLRLLWGYKI